MGFDDRFDLSLFNAAFCNSFKLTEVDVQDRSDQNRKNRKRSKRRMILCPKHGCYLDSASPKYPIFADSVAQLQERGVNRLNAQQLLAYRPTVSLEGEWLEAFWCVECQDNCWYHVRKINEKLGKGRYHYQLSVVPPELWQRSVGTIHPMGNPSVGEFTRRNSKMVTFGGVKDFRFM